MQSRLKWQERDGWGDWNGLNTCLDSKLLQSASGVIRRNHCSVELVNYDGGGVTDVSDIMSATYTHTCY